jgi:HEAT repeat protein
MNPFFFCKTFCARWISVSLLTVCALMLVSPAVDAQKRAQVLHNPTSGDPVPKLLLLRIVRAEDERRWDDDLRSLFRARNANVRSRAALAAGRIGNDAAVADLTELLRHDDETEVRAMAAFALGEIESPLGADALLAALKKTREAPLRARAVEALGKIAAALPKEQEARGKELGAAILDVLSVEAHRRAAPDRSTLLLGITAVLRAKPASAGPLLAEFLAWTDPRIRADAANALARLKLKDGNEQLRKLLVRDADPIVRANAARVLGTTEDKGSFGSLLDRALNDKDARVRVSAIRAFASLKDSRSTVPLRNRGKLLMSLSDSALPPQLGEILEIATTLGRVLQGSADKETLDLLSAVRGVFNNSAPEAEIAYARVSPENYLAEFGNGKTARQNAQKTLLLNWRAGSSRAQGLGEFAPCRNQTKTNRF